MDIAIVGLAGSGKTSLLKALAAGHLPQHGSPNEAVLAVVKVPDTRLDALATLVAAKKTTYLELRMLDFPALTAGKKGPAPDLVVLPMDTIPIAWVRRGNGVLVQWPRGIRRVVLPGGRTSAPAPEDIAAAPGERERRLRARGGELVLESDHGDVVLYPPQGAIGGTP